MKLTEVLSTVIELFYPRYCHVCNNSLISQEEFICTTCLCKAPIVRKEMQEHIESLFWGILPIEKSNTLWYYHKGSPYAHLIHKIKYENETGLAQFLGTLLATKELSSGFFDTIDYIIPVPTHPKKLKIRGYNQAECIALGIAKQTHIPILNHCIVKESQTDSQTTKSGYERHLNPTGSFKLIDGAILENKHILIVDDVLTTGATITACAEELLKAGNVHISIATITASK